MKRQGFFTANRYKYSHQKARSHMYQLVKEGIAVYDRNNALKEEVRISLAKMRKIVCCTGEFIPSSQFPMQVCYIFAKRKNWEIIEDGYGLVEAFMARQGVVYPYDISRDDVDLVAAFEEYGYSKSYRIVEIPSNAKWKICSNEDGYEWVVEKHREWR